MQLLYPIGLLALAGLIIPVIIHLWSVKKGKTLKIGSIILLGESANATSKSLRITDWLLFILRCLLLIVIGLILTQPYLQKQLKITKNLGWIVVGQNNFSEIYAGKKQQIDSLLNLGFELHDFNFGFNQFELKDSLQKVQQSSLSYFSLLNQLNKDIPAGYGVYLYAPKKLAAMDESLPKINFKLNWVETKLQDSLKTWTTNFLGKTYEASSSPTKTSYTYKTNQELPAIKVLIVEPEGNDAKYIKAALKTIADYTNRKFEVVVGSANLKADVVFWLSEQQMPNSFLNQLKPSTKILSYVKGKASAINTTLNLNFANDQQIKIYQKTTAPIKAGEIIWTDGFGEPILIKQKDVEYYFYSKFNPKWSDLVWNESFVNALLPIVLGDQSVAEFGFEKNENDQRIVANSQNLYLNDANHKKNLSNLTTVVLTKYLWILALLILLLERILSFKKIKDAKN